MKGGCLFLYNCYLQRFLSSAALISCGVHAIYDACIPAWSLFAHDNKAIYPFGRMKGLIIWKLDLYSFDDYG